jgi:hypothetical protein
LLKNNKVFALPTTPFPADFLLWDIWMKIFSTGRKISDDYRTETIPVLIDKNH